jgi:hypothetical protein
MWDKDRYPQTLRDAAAVHSILNTLGYSPKDEIFLILDAAGVAVQLKAEGRSWAIRIGKAERPLPEMKELWVELIKDWNVGGVMGKEEKDEVCISSTIWPHKAEIVLSLSRKGFKRWLR